MIMNYSTNMPFTDKPMGSTHHSKDACYKCPICGAHGTQPMEMHCDRTYPIPPNAQMSNTPLHKEIRARLEYATTSGENLDFAVDSIVMLMKENKEKMLGEIQRKIGATKRYCEESGPCFCTGKLCKKSGSIMNTAIDKDIAIIEEYKKKI